jgi:tRNA pseudouridine38-40 synthase
LTLFESPEHTPERPSEATPAQLVRIRATVAYDGTDYSGFAVQSGGPRTIGGDLTAAITRVLGHRIDLTCAGRTDSGVHAWGQVVSFDADAEHLDLDGLQRSVNKQLRPQIAIRSIECAPPAFDARFSARSRRYRYTVLNTPAPSPFLARTAWWIDSPLDLKAMRLACDPLIGEHDFSSFCRRPNDDASLTRRVLDAHWDEQDDGRLELWIEANAFCHQMVRAIVGTLVEVGVGKKRAGDLTGILRAGDRSAAGQLAPPHGLCLWQVDYPVE